MKSRLGGQLDLNHLNASVDNDSLSKTQRNIHNHDDCLVQEDIFAKTASRLTKSNFSHHQQ